MPISRKSNDYTLHQEDDLCYASFPIFDQTQMVNHGFSTRLGGCSQGIYTSLNLGLYSGDKVDNVRFNYKKICSALNIDPEYLVFSDQIHGNHIYCATKEDCGKGFYRKSDIKGIDGLITNDPNVPLITFYADCVPLYFLDPVQKVIGLAHAGWRGTILKIAAKMVDRFVSAYASNPTNILVGIGPSLGPCCFEVDESVAHTFQNQIQGKDWIRTLKNGKYKIDLWKVNQQILLESGIIGENISVMKLCTVCHKDIFFSHRGHQGKRGSLAAIMALKE